MKETLHYLLMTDHFLFQKTLFGKIKETGLSIGQPKVLDYLKEHDGTTQREIAAACQIEPASLTSILNGMEKANLIERKTLDGNRRSWHIFLTEKGSSFKLSLISIILPDCVFIVMRYHCPIPEIE